MDNERKFDPVILSSYKRSIFINWKYNKEWLLYANLL